MREKKNLACSHQDFGHCTLDVQAWLKYIKLCCLKVTILTDFSCAEQ